VLPHHREHGDKIPRVSNARLHEGNIPRNV
jgi:hypothetical protein